MHAHSHWQEARLDKLGTKSLGLQYEIIRSLSPLSRPYIPFNLYQPIKITLFKQCLCKYYTFSHTNWKYFYIDPIQYGGGEVERLFEPIHLIREVLKKRRRKITLRWVGGVGTELIFRYLFFFLHELITFKIA